MSENLVFVNRLYDESFTLLVEARNYFEFHQAKMRQYRKSKGEDALFVNYQALRLTSRMTQGMAWLLAQRAVETGELTHEQAWGGDFSLGREEICTSADGHDDGRIPDGMRALLDRSHSLYMRILRLDEAAQEKVRSSQDGSQMMQ